ncbi:MAG: hypothetical protein AAFY34_14535 [Pseudomonadota bacterium]
MGNAEDDLADFVEALIFTTLAWLRFVRDQALLRQVTLTPFLAVAPGFVLGAFFSCKCGQSLTDPTILLTKA